MIYTTPCLNIESTYFLFKLNFYHQLLNHSTTTISTSIMYILDPPCDEMYITHEEACTAFIDVNDVCSTYSL